MSNSECEKRIYELINMTKNGYLHYSEDEILSLYDEICGIIYKNEGDYTEEQRQKLKTKSYLESLAIVQDWILYERKKKRERIYRRINNKNENFI